MGGTITLGAGHDAKYYTSQMGGGRGANTDYYLSATEKQGEPQGTWVGEGLADLGIHDGDLIESSVFEAIYGAFVNPMTGETIGGPPRVNSELRKLFESKKAAEPGLTRERERELWIEARAEVKSAGVMFWDSTFSVEKSISLAHATALASARKAREAGGLQEAADWEARAASIWAEIEQAVRVWVSYAQDESRIVRTGHHGRRVQGVEQGRFEDSHEIPVAIFPQHLNRNGDIHLHVHVLWLNRVKTVSDGKWRAIDSRSLHRVRGSGSALAHLSLETALAQRHGFGFVYRPKSRARVIEGCDDKMIGAFSSRRAEISRATLGLAEEYEQRYGRQPDRRAVWSLSQYAQRHTRQAKPDERLDFAKLLADWDEQSRRGELGSLTELAGSIWRGGLAQAQAQLRRAGELSPKQERELMLHALADAQQARATFSRETLIHRLGEAMPDYVVAKGPQHARMMLEGLADRILAGEGGETVHCVTAGEFPRVPDWLRRASGESIYRPPGSRLYATESQLGMEQRIIARAQAESAPRLNPETSARLLGAEADELEERLWNSGQAQDTVAGSSLRLDQAAVAHHMLTSKRRAEVGVALAGAGKTFLAGKMADIWRAAGMGRVFGLALASVGRNELMAASPEIAGYNLAEFFGDLPGKPGARGTADLGENALIIVDEAGLPGMSDYDRLFRAAESQGAKIVFLGDTHQLSSPDSGGGLAMLSRQLGYAQLTEAIRFEDAWQRDASVALRAGDIQSLATYDEHGRLHGGSYEEMAEAAARAYLADFLAGKDTLLVANSNEEVRDLGMRVQSLLREWGQLGAESVPLRENARAYIGDRITARQNTRTVLNGDTLTVTAITEQGIVAVKEDGQAVELPAAYVTRHADLGYARTWMTSQGKTVADSSHSLVPSMATRNGFYESMTRSRRENHAWLYEADPECPPAQAAPEVDRARLRSAERRGELIERTGSADAVTLAAQVVRRLDEPMSATETRERSFSGADSLAVLWPILNDQIRADGARRYETELRRLLGTEDAEAALKDTDDLYRALRHAELAGRDAGHVLREAVSVRDLAGARSVPAVLASRVREATEALPAALRNSWLERVPACADRERQEFLTRLARAMDDRQVRLGQHVAETAPVWSVQALGAVPEAGAAERAAWETSAARIAAAREILGWEHEGLALGPMPGTTSPEFRAEWQSALAAMAKVDGVDVRGMTDGLLFVRRSAFERETAWAPASVSEELRVIRLTRSQASTEAARCGQDALAARRAGRAAWASLHESRRADRVAVAAKCDRLLADLEPAQQTRREWEALTADTRRVALAADLELKRRGVLTADEPMKSSEPEGLVPGEVAAADRDDTIRREIGIETGSSEITARVAELAERSRQTQARIDELRSMHEHHSEDNDLMPAQAWGQLLARERDAILQPPVQFVPASREVEADREAS